MTHSESTRKAARRKLAPLAALALAALIGAGCSGSSDDGGTGSGSGSGSAANHEQGMKFAACMRDNGVGEFPDPDASGELTIDEVANNSSLDTSSAAFERAMSACEDLQPSGFTGEKRSAEQQRAALEFAQCIRDNGVPDFPDPTDDSPLVDTNRIPSAADPGGMDRLNAAMEKCGDKAAGAGVSPQ